MQPYSTQHKGHPKFIARRFKGVPGYAKGISKSAKQQVHAAGRSRHKAERQLVRILIKNHLKKETG